MVKKRDLTLQKIIEASISLINVKGLHAFTMRSLAVKLGVQASAVYWHVKNKEELLQLLSVSISRKIQYPDAQLGWKAKMIYLAEQSKQAMSSIRNGPEIMMQTIPSDPSRLNLIEYMLKILTEAGFTPQKALEIANLLNNYTILYTMDESIRAEQQSDPSFQEYIHSFLTTLSEHYPHFHKAMLGQMKNTQKNSSFLSGLKAILDGYELSMHEQ